MNKTVISGKIKNKPLKFIFESSGEKFYKTYIEIERYGRRKKDEIPIVVSERECSKIKEYFGKTVRITGELKYNSEDLNNNNLELYMGVKKIF